MRDFKVSTKKLKVLLLEKGIDSADKFAKATGLSSCAASFILNGKRAAKVETIGKICKALGVSPDELLVPVPVPEDKPRQRKGGVQMFSNAKFRNLLIEKGLDGKTFSRMCGLSPTTVYAIINGACKPKLATISALSKALGVSPAELMDDN